VARQAGGGGAAGGHRSRLHRRHCGVRGGEGPGHPSGHAAAGDTDHLSRRPCGFGAARRLRGVAPSSGGGDRASCAHRSGPFHRRAVDPSGAFAGKAAGGGKSRPRNQERDPARGRRMPDLFRGTGTLAPPGEAGGGDGQAGRSAHPAARGSAGGHRASPAGGDSGYFAGHLPPAGAGRHPGRARIVGAGPQAGAGHLGLGGGRALHPCPAWRGRGPATARPAEELRTRAGSRSGPPPAGDGMARRLHAAAEGGGAATASSSRRGTRAISCSPATGPRRSAGTSAAVCTSRGRTVTRSTWAPPAAGPTASRSIPTSA